VLVAIVNQSFLSSTGRTQRRPRGDRRRIRHSWDKDKDKWMQVVGVMRDEKHYGWTRKCGPASLCRIEKYRWTP